MWKYTVALTFLKYLFFYHLYELNLDSGCIITFDEERTIEQDGKEIRVIPAWKWMLTE
jgi:predicted AAA+ superfamily ATPase